MSRQKFNTQPRVFAAIVPVKHPTVPSWRRWGTALLLSLVLGWGGFPARAAQPDTTAPRAKSTPLVLSEAQRARLQQALAEWHPRYDAAARMIRRPFSSPGYHTTLKGGEVHPTRDSLNYAVALLDSGEPQWLRRAEDILRQVIALQDQNPASKTYGIWPWFLEEPLERMSPPDWNWADFCGVQLLQVVLNHRHRLSPDVAHLVDTALVHAARSIQRRNVGPAYTNIAIMGSYVTLLVAELYGLDDLRDYALQRWRAFHAFTMPAQAFAEYNSPTYTVVALKEIARIRQHVQNPEARRLAEDVYRVAWQEIATHFHPPTAQWAGPHSRAYRTLLPPDTLALIQRSTSGRVRLLDTEPPPALDEHRLATPCPPDLIPLFAGLEQPRELVKTFVPGSPPVIGTTYLHPLFALGTVNRGDLWNQRRSLLAYWGAARQPAYLHLRCLRDGYDFAAAQFFSVQRRGHALAAVTFATDGGNTHVSLDRLKNAAFQCKDLRLRFEFGGAAGRTAPPAPPSLHEPADLRFGDLRLRLAAPFARWGETAARWEAGQAPDGKTAWLDLVLYTGPQTTIQLDQLRTAAVGLAVLFTTGPETPGSPRAELNHDRLTLALDTPRLQLTAPARPDKVSVLQKSFQATAEP